jgi:WD40 repeat protein
MSLASTLPLHPPNRPPPRPAPTRRALLHHFSFKATVRAAAFSPDGKYVAAAVGRLLQVWKAPSLAKVVAPMELHRTYGQCHADITALDWSADSQWLLAASKDLSIRHACVWACVGRGRGGGTACGWRAKVCVNRLGI